MDEKECAIAYEELVAILMEFKLGWVVEEVADVVNIGKTVEERSPTRKTPLTKIEDYTPQEQLLLLIHAVEQAVANTLEMEHKIAEFLTKDSETSQLATAITFCSPSRKSEKTLELTPDSLDSRKTSAVELKELLEQIRLEAFRSVE